MALSLLTWNLANPSAERAKKQLDWLASRDEQILVLTETKDNAGCQLLADAYQAAGYTVVFPKPGNGDYGTMIVSRVHAAADSFGDRIGYLPARAAAALVLIGSRQLRVLGMYVPSRDVGLEKTERKKKWLAACRTALRSDQTADPATSTILLGDLNVLEPDHQPAYKFFAPFEYDFYQALTNDHGLVDAYRCLNPHDVEHSWVGRTGDGYRYDHAFCSAQLQNRIAACGYDHSPRLDKLSDHSAMTLTLDIATPDEYSTSDPATASEEPSLF